MFDDDFIIRQVGRQQKNNLPRGSDNFVRLGKYVKDDYLEHKITFEEMVVLIWLFLGANCYNGKHKVSYEELVKDLTGLVKGRKKNYRKNFMNKVLLALKQKKYLFYHKQQGRRSSFMVELNNYPLKDRKFTNIDFKLEKEKSRSQEIDSSKNTAEDVLEVGSSEQKSEKEMDEQAEQHFNSLL